MIDSKLIGSILLITGTSIGAGMLGLPIVTAQMGFIPSIVLLLFCWFIMTTSAFLLLEANLWLPTSSNIISIAKTTLGPAGQLLTWGAYLLLLYSLLCAYIAGGSDLLHNLLSAAGFEIPFYISAIAFTLLLSFVVTLGIHAVDYVNRGFMSVKFLAYFLLVLLLIPFISIPQLVANDVKHITSAQAITVSITSFGYATIIPSLRVYFYSNIKKLKTAIFWGSLIPLLCYIFWNAVIIGIIPLDGTHGLMEILHSKTSTSDLVKTLNLSVNNGATSNSINFFVKLFTSICVVTSFLGVALCLVDFLADGFQLEKKGYGRIFIYLTTFLPPLLSVLFFPNIFLGALEYAGIYTVILLMLLPALMVWCGRYRRHISQGFYVRGGKKLLAFIIVSSVILIIWGLLGKN